MLGALDHTTTDVLHNFHEALRRSQEALQQEELRLSQLTQAVREQHESNQSNRDIIRSQQQQRLDGLRREIMRVRSLVDRQEAEAAAQQQHVEAVRRPRREAEAETQASKKCLRDLQREYLSQSAALHADLLQWWQPQNSLMSLEAQVRRKADEVSALEGIVREQQQHLREYTGKDTVNAEKKDADDNNNEVNDNEEEETNAADDAQKRNNSPMVLEQQLTQQREERETFMREADERVTRRREEAESLKGRLKQLCADVEAADAAQQAAHQTFHAALNQQSDARVVCGVCGNEIVGSFVS